MSLRSKPRELVDELKGCFAPDAFGSARKSASPLGITEANVAALQTA
jgi:hypothetical protein